MAPGPEGVYERFQNDVNLFTAAGADAQVQRVIAALNGLARALEKYYAKQNSRIGITNVEWDVLAQLALARGESRTPSQLAEATGVAPSSMTYRLDRMAEHDLITREVDPENRARIKVMLSEHGWETFSLVIRDANRVEADILGPLTEWQRDQLATLLERVLENVGTLPDPTSLQEA